MDHDDVRMNTNAHAGNTRLGQPLCIWRAGVPLHSFVDYLFVQFFFSITAEQILLEPLGMIHHD